MKVKIYFALSLMLGLIVLKGFCAESKKNIDSGAQLLCSVISRSNQNAKRQILAGANANFQGLNGLTPLMAAVIWCADVELIRLLIAHGADVHAKTGNEPAMEFHGLTALHYLAESKHCSIENFQAIADILLAAGAKIDEKDANGNTPLHFAARRGFANSVQYLLSKGANPSIRNNDGKLPVDLLHPAWRGMRALFPASARMPAKNE